MKTNLTKKQISSLFSKDDRHGSIKGVLYEPKKNSLTATNGHALISYKVEPCENDSTGILPTELFKTKKTDKCEYQINGKATRKSDDGTSTYNLIDENYPDYESVTPDINNSHEIGVNLELLKKLCDSVPSDNFKNKYIKLIINKDDVNCAIKFEQFIAHNDSSDPEYSGLIMPVRINS